MPKFSEIPNRTVTSISIDKEKLEKCKEKGVNISLVVDEALSRELNLDSKEAFTQAIEKQNKLMRNFIEDNNLIGHFDFYKYGGDENALVAKPKQAARQVAGNFEGV